MWDTCRVERCGIWCDMLVWYFADVALYMSCWCDCTRGKICLINLVCEPLDYPYYPKPLDLRFGNLPRDWITHTVRVRSNNYADLGRADSGRWCHASLLVYESILACSVDPTWTGLSGMSCARAVMRRPSCRPSPQAPSKVVKKKGFQWKLLEAREGSCGVLFGLFLLHNFSNLISYNAMVLKVMLLSMSW